MLIHGGDPVDAVDAVDAGETASNYFQRLELSSMNACECTHASRVNMHRNIY